MSNVSKNLNLVREKMKNAYLKRAVELQTGEPRLVAVSKTKPVEIIIEAYKSGQRHFGENYVQEIVEKGFDEEILEACSEIKWHYIGHLQRNKVRKLLSVPNLFVVETVDTEKLADALNSRVDDIKKKSDDKFNICVQVNTSGEAAKSGCKPEEASDVVKYIIENCKNLNVLGLMTIGKYDNYDLQSGINPDFQTLIDCRMKVCKDLNLDINKFELSMGMSGDYEHAVEVGATSVRVGSLIFGDRPGQNLQKPNLEVNDKVEGEVKLLTTQCIVKELEKLGSATFGALLIIKQFGIHQCGHGKSPVPASECILQMITEKNPSRYIIASQDRELQKKCRKIEGVPLLYLHSRTPVLEPPSFLTQDAANEKTLSRFSVSTFDKHKLTLLNKEEEGGGGENDETKRKKRKQKGGPNPLSCKKKKKKPYENVKSKDESSNKKKRKRNRNRLVKKIKREVMASLDS